MAFHCAACSLIEEERNFPGRQRKADGRKQLMRAGLAMALAHSLRELPPLATGSSRLYLCRHGETEYNAQSLLQGSGIDASLNELGRTQAASLADTLSATRLDEVASSTLSRAVETADAVASLQAASVQRSRHAGLVELCHGSLEGVPLADCRPQLKELTDAWMRGATDVPVGGDGESADMLLARAQAALWTDGCLLGSSEAGRHVAAVAHSTLNRAVLAVAVGKPLGEMFSIQQDNCCINVLDFEMTSGAVSVVALNIKPVV